MPRIIELSNLNDIIKRYKSGVSVNQLSKENGVSRSVISRLLSSNDVQLRSHSESECIKWSNMSEQQRKRQVQKAHEAARGRLVSTAEKMKRAKSAYFNHFKKGLHELEICEILKYKGYQAIIQKNLGIYNIDLSIHEFPICIEIQSNNHHSLRSPKILKRTKYILNSKKFLLYIIIDQSKNPILYESIANKIISYLNVLSLDESICGKYAMIGRNGDSFTSTRYNFNDFARIE